jgi:hypothetical protein
MPDARRMVDECLVRRAPGARHCARSVIRSLGSGGRSLGWFIFANRNLCGYRRCDRWTDDSHAGMFQSIRSVTVRC